MTFQDYDKEKSTYKKLITGNKRHISKAMLYKTCSAIWLMAAIEAGSSLAMEFGDTSQLSEKWTNESVRATDVLPSLKAGESWIKRRMSTFVGLTPVLHKEKLISTKPKAGERDGVASITKRTYFTTCIKYNADTIFFTL